jgi:hypothetical protein
MRTVYWLFLVSVGLFVSGIGFLIAGAGPTQEVRSAEPPPTVAVASVRQIMNGIVRPAAREVYASVGTIITAAGADERRPRTDAEWTAVGDSAAALVEAANLLMMEGRAVDKDDWTTISKAMADASIVALKAIEARDPEALFASGEGINASCNACHQKYQR